MSFQSTPRSIMVLIEPSTLNTFGNAREVAGMTDSSVHSAMAAANEISSQT